MPSNLRSVLSAITCLLFMSVGTITSFAQTFTGSPGLVPPDGTPALLPVDVQGLPNVMNKDFGLLRLCINATHTWMEDLNIVLVAPDGQKIQIVTSVGYDQDGFANTCFDPKSSTSIGMGSYPFTGSFLPMGTMQNFNNGKNPNGTWYLKVSDNYPGADDGEITSWSIEFGPDAVGPIIFSGSKLPLVCFETEGKTIVSDPQVLVKMKIISDSTGALNYPNGLPNVYNGFTNIRIRGQSSQSFPKKSYGIETADEVGNDTSFTILGMPSESDWVLNASFSDKTLLRNVLAHDLFNKMGHYSSRKRFVEVFIDEEYQGTYILLEKIKRDKNRVNVKKLKSTDVSGKNVTGGYILKVDKGDDGGWTSTRESVKPNTHCYYQYVYPKLSDIQPEQQTYIQAFIDSLEEALYSPDFRNSAGKHYTDYLDLSSFIDNFIMNELSRNIDGYRLSTYFHKAHIQDGNKLKAGPMWDFDLSFRNSDFCNGALIEGWSFAEECDFDYFPPPMFMFNMMNDSIFWKEVRCRWNDLRDGLLTSDSLNYTIDTWVTELNGAVDRNFERWPILGNYVWPNPWPIAQNYPEEIEQLKTWIAGRLLWMDENLPYKDEYCGTTSTISISQASVQLTPSPATNNLTIRFGDIRFANRPEMKIINTYGQVVKNIYFDKEKQMTIDISGLVAGFYSIILNDEAKTVKSFLKIN